MSISSKFHGIWRRERAKSIIRAAEKSARPLTDLSGAVLTAALTCAGALKADINPEKSPETWIYVCFENVYFFMHLVNRSAFSVLGGDRRNVLQNKLAPAVVKGIVAALFDHWPEERKLGIEREFFAKLNATELEYATCRGLLSKEAFTGHGLIDTLARNVAELLGKPLDPIIIVKTVEAVTSQLEKFNLNALVKAAGSGSVLKL